MGTLKDKSDEILKSYQSLADKHVEVGKETANVIDKNKQNINKVYDESLENINNTYNEVEDTFNNKIKEWKLEKAKKETEDTIKSKEEKNVAKWVSATQMVRALANLGGTVYGGNNNLGKNDYDKDWMQEVDKRKKEREAGIKELKNHIDEDKKALLQAKLNKMGLKNNILLGKAQQTAQAEKDMNAAISSGIISGEQAKVQGLGKGIEERNTTYQLNESRNRYNIELGLKEKELAQAREAKEKELAQARELAISARKYDEEKARKLDKDLIMLKLNKIDKDRPATTVYIKEKDLVANVAKQIGTGIMSKQDELTFDVLNKGGKIDYSIAAKYVEKYPQINDVIRRFYQEKEQDDEHKDIEKEEEEVNELENLWNTLSKQNDSTKIVSSSIRSKDSINLNNRNDSTKLGSRKDSTMTEEEELKRWLNGK